jgi:hypothetical protein
MPISLRNFYASMMPFSASTVSIPEGFSPSFFRDPAGEVLLFEVNKPENREDFINIGRLFIKELSITVEPITADFHGYSYSWFSSPCPTISITFTQLANDLMLASTCFSIIMERVKQEIYEILREYNEAEMHDRYFNFDPNYSFGIVFYKYLSQWNFKIPLDNGETFNIRVATPHLRPGSKIPKRTVKNRGRVKV